MAGSADIIALKGKTMARWLDEVVAEAEQLGAVRACITLFSNENRVTMEYELTRADAALLIVDALDMSLNGFTPDERPNRSR